MKSSFLIFTCLLATSLIWSQNSISKANKSFDNFHFKTAIKEYERKARKGDDSKETLQKLGDAYYYNADMNNSVKWYGQLFSKYERTLEIEYVFKYIHSLKGVGNYDLAKALMKIYGDKVNSDSFEVAHFNDNDEQLDELMKRQPEFAITHLSFNSAYADFGPMYYQNKIVFASSRDSSKLHTRKYQWNEQPYLNLYEADTLRLGSDLVTVTPFGNDINTKYHEAITTFNSEGTVMYFTRNNYTNKNLKRDAEGTNHLKLYRSELQGGFWTIPVELPFNSDEYSVGQPVLGPDNTKLYFVSDMPGGYGSTDIYYVELNEDGGYSEPKNLGAEINTGGREMFPYVTDEKIYFASDGHLGLGGLDIFEIDKNNNTSKPNNLGPVLNSRFDDFALIINESDNRGYFTSNREGGKGDDDIYSFQRLTTACDQAVMGSVRRKVNELPVIDAEVILKTQEGEVIATTMTDSYGRFSMDLMLDCEKKYNFFVSKGGYESLEKSFTTSDEPGKINNVPMVMTKELNELIVVEDGVMKIKIDNIYFDLNKADIRPDAAQELNKIVEIMKEYPNMIIKIESHTDARGSDQYNEKLSDRRAKSTGNYIVSQGIERERIESAIGYGEKQLLNRCSNGIKCSNSEHDINRRSEFIIVQLQ